eukprot:m.202275 g.202275  ORF g.202275 m.202275 type:complete len:268 (-) comp25981_c0_seq3:7558-8361(-)
MSHNARLGQKRKRKKLSAPVPIPAEEHPNLTDDETTHNHPTSNVVEVEAEEEQDEENQEETITLFGNENIPKLNLDEFNAQQARKGVIYLSSIPPFMKISKLRHLLGQFGALGRVYLKPESPLARKKRKKFGGNGKKKFTEGWVEFEDKKIAKKVAAALNGTIIGGKKRGYYHDDMWNMKYLPRFKWRNLTERLAYERAMKQKQLEAEMTQIRKESNLYQAAVFKAKKIAHKKKKRKLEQGGGATQAEEAEEERIRHVPQRTTAVEG